MAKTPEQYRVEDQEARNAVIAQAWMKGFTVVFGDATHLLLDIDKPELDWDFYLRFGMIADRFGAWIADEDIWESKSGNKHVRVTLAVSLPVEHRIALQAMMGSDYRKEMMSLCSVWLEAVDNPILLFKPPMKLLPRWRKKFLEKGRRA